MESSEVVPSADFDGAWQPSILIVFVAALRHQQRRRIEAELESIGVADLRVAGAVGAHGIAVIYADHQAPLVIRLERDADAGGGERIGRATARQIGGGE